jgi:hypothetical protein
VVQHHALSFKSANRDNTRRSKALVDLQEKHLKETCDDKGKEKVANDR